MRSLFFILFFLFTPTLAFSQDETLTKRSDVKKFIHALYQEQGFNPREITKALSEAQIQSAIIESVTKPYEKKNWDVYKKIFLTEERIHEGVQFYINNKTSLEKAEQTFGVPASIIIAILGVETLYGKHQGNYRVLDALATLAFNYPPRSAFFTQELKEFFILCREHHIAPTAYYGSYAGAMGKPQFMPSSYRHFATDFSGKAKKDLMNDNEAAIASIGNYLNKHGWLKNQPVADKAIIKGNGYQHFNTQFKKAFYTPNQLEKAGVHPMHPSNNKPAKSGLIDLILENGHEYWLTYPNFYVITRYNSSPQYALVVFLLSKELEKHMSEPINKKGT